MKTWTPKAGEITREWFIVDADGQTLGRLATRVASVLRGKHKPTFAPHMDMGDHVIVINAEKIAVAEGREDKKVYHSHSGYPGGLKSVPFARLKDRRPTAVFERAVRGMLPKNKLGRAQITKLKVYAGSDHPHAAQNPQPLP